MMIMMTNADCLIIDDDYNDGGGGGTDFLGGYFIF